MNQYPRIRTGLAIGSGLLMVGGLAACGEQTNERPDAERTSAAPSPVRTTEASPSPQAIETIKQVGQTAVFDSLGGDIPTINVYQGVGNTPEDKTPSGQYLDDDSVQVSCKIIGRTVTSVASDGERLAELNQWVRLSAEAVEGYATATYLEDPKALLAILPNASN